jgi:hypothetical protein
MHDRIQANAATSTAGGGTAAATGCTLRMAARDLEFPGKYLDELTDSTAYLADTDRLRARLEDDGYLLLRQLLPTDLVLEARRQMLTVLSGRGALDPDRDLLDAVAAPDGRGGFFGGTNELTCCPAYLQLVSCEPLMAFMSRLLGGPAMKFDFNWLRVVPPGDNSPAHYDICFMGRGTHRLYTAWIPLGDVPFEQGPLTILAGSHRFKRLVETYGAMDVDRDNVEGGFSNDPVEMVDTFGGQWLTTTFKTGDILMFGMFTMHASLSNVSPSFRLSSDTRYQLAADPVDERWMGENPIGHYAWNKTPALPMAEARRRWGV